MNIINFSDARARLRGNSTFDSPRSEVSNARTEAIRSARAIEWTAIQETLNLLSNPANAERLRAAIAELDPR